MDDQPSSRTPSVDKFSDSSCISVWLLQQNSVYKNPELFQLPKAKETSQLEKKKRKRKKKRTMPFQFSIHMCRLFFYIALHYRSLHIQGVGTIFLTFQRNKNTFDFFLDVYVEQQVIMEEENVMRSMDGFFKRFIPFTPYMVQLLTAETAWRGRKR